MMSTRQHAAGRSGAPPQPGGLRAAGVALLLVLPAWLMAVYPPWAEWLEFHRESVASGEFWRLLTCHWTHWSLDHLAWDAVPFALLAWLSWRISPRRTVWTLGLSSFLIPAGVWFLSPQVVTYRGLSGLDSALFLGVALELCRRSVRSRQWGTVALAGGLLVGFAAKVLFEQVSGTTAFADSAFFLPLPLAHLIGAQCGALAVAAGARRVPTRVQSCPSTHGISGSGRGHPYHVHGSVRESRTKV
jgi:rhomboid family GlyGly-CTERM serine protease